MGHLGQVLLKKPASYLAVVGGSSGPPVYSVQYQAVLDKAIALGYPLPSMHQRLMQDTLMLALIASGVFAKMDLLYITANDGSWEFGTLNWKDPNGAFNMTKVGANPLPWVPNLGSFSDGTDAYLTTNYTPSLHRVQFQQNACSMTVVTKSGYENAGYMVPLGADYSAGTVRDILLLKYIQSNTGSIIAGLQGPQSANVAQPASVRGIWTLNRASSANIEVYVNGISFTGVIASVSSANIVDRPIIFAGNTFATGVVTAEYQYNNPIAAAFVGANMTVGEMTALTTALNNYLDALYYITSTPAPGAGNWTCPAGINQVLVECWGAGGAGLGFVSATTLTSGSGGGGGAYAASVVNVVPGNVYPYVVGAGGAGAAGAGANGGSTTFNGGVISAVGGTRASVATAGGAGGLASACVGDTKYNGAAGGAGFNSGVSGGGCPGSGGSGPGATGISYPGVNGSNTAGVIAFTKGPPLGGGNSQSGTNTTDLAGTWGGTACGGAGARRTTVTKNGGNGGSGFIRISAPKSY